jgi:hypothetical protein
VAFLSGLREHVAPGGMVAIVCPDATTPDVELLIADHEVSLTPPHLEALLARAGLAIIGQSTAPPALGAFQMAVAQPATATTRMIPTHRVDAARDYLERWAALDARLLDRLGTGAVVCFGTGEAAGLLRAYAPRTWARVAACTVDGEPQGPRFGDRALVPLAAVDTRATLLLAVRAADQPAVQERLRQSHQRVVAWYDAI